MRNGPEDNEYYMEISADEDDDEDGNNSDTPINEEILGLINYARLDKFFANNFNRSGKITVLFTGSNAIPLLDYLTSLRQKGKLPRNPNWSFGINYLRVKKMSQIKTLKRLREAYDKFFIDLVLLEFKFDDISILEVYKGLSMAKTI